MKNRHEIGPKVGSWMSHFTAYRSKPTWLRKAISTQLSEA